MRVSIILTSYSPDKEVGEHLKRFLKSLEDTTDRDRYQFIVVENGSFTPELKEKADIYIHKDQPIGNARALNIGMSLADEDILVIVSNDLILSSGWLEGLLKEYQSGILSPMTAGEGVIPEPKIYENWHWYALFMINRSTFKKVGYFDETMPYRFHDQDYSIRLKKAGFPVRRTGKVIIKHVNMVTHNKLLKHDKFGSMFRTSVTVEGAEMTKRHGCQDFHEWIRKHG